MKMSQACLGGFPLRVESKSQPKHTFLRVRGSHFIEDRNEGLNENKQSMWKRKCLRGIYLKIRAVGWTQELRRSLKPRRITLSTWGKSKQMKREDRWRWTQRWHQRAPRPFQYMWRILKKQDRRNTIELEMLERIRRPLRNWNRIL